MSVLNLKGFRAKEINFVNKVENGTKIEFENKFSYNVNYSKNNICRGELSYSAVAKEFPEKFHIIITLEGLFDFDPTVAKEKIHIESFKQLFPYAKALVTTVTANAGIPPLLVPAVDIEKSSIYRFDGMIPPQKNPDNGGE